MAVLLVCHWPCQLAQSPGPMCDTHYPASNSNSERHVSCPPPLPAGSKEWLLPPEEIWPEATHTAGHIACDSDFLDCDDDECGVEVGGLGGPRAGAGLVGRKC